MSTDAPVYPCPKETRRVTNAGLMRRPTFASPRPTVPTMENIHHNSPASPVPSGGFDAPASTARSFLEDFFSHSGPGS